ncbi:RNA-binding domain-containing protein, partial [Ceraceosorus guamensis]
MSTSRSRSRSRSSSRGRGRTSSSRSRSTSASRSPPARRARAAERSPRRPDQAGRGAKQEEMRTVAVGGLSKAVHARHLEYIFGEYGSIEHVLLPRYKLSGENKGEAYIVYRTPEEASMAKSYMHAGQIDGCVISVELSSLP